MLSSEELLRTTLDFIKVKSLICEDEIRELYRENPDRTNLVLDKVLDRVATGLIDAHFRNVIFCCYCKFWKKDSRFVGQEDLRSCSKDLTGLTWTAPDFFCGEAEDDMSGVMCGVNSVELNDNYDEDSYEDIEQEGDLKGDF